MTVSIISDTACDLPDQVVSALKVGLVPLHVRFGQTELLDRRELDSKEFWSRCAAQSELPTTAAPSPGAFSNAFEAAVGEGATAIVCMTLSSKLSATHEAASQAARSFKSVPVEVVDSLSATVGQGLLVIEAAEAAAAGASVEEVVAVAVSGRQRVRVMGALDTLENLKKGGRIGGASALLGTMLSIKPVIEVRDGLVEQESRQRTRAKSLRYLADCARQAGQLERVALAGANADDFDEFVRSLGDLPSKYPVLIGDVGPVISAHTGAGTVAVAWLTPS